MQRIRGDALNNIFATRSGQRASQAMRATKRLRYGQRAPSDAFKNQGLFICSSKANHLDIQIKRPYQSF